MYFDAEASKEGLFFYDYVLGELECTKQVRRGFFITPPHGDRNSDAAHNNVHPTKTHRTPTDRRLLYDCKLLYIANN